PPERGHERRRAEADQEADGDVRRVVDADEDAVERDRRRGEEQERTEAAAEHEHGEGDRERDGGVVARKAVVRRVVDEEHRLLRMVDERTVVVPQVPEDGVRGQTHDRRGGGGRGRELQARRAAGPGKQPQQRRRDHEDVDGGRVEDLGGVLTSVARLRGAVQPVEDRPVQSPNGSRVSERSVTVARSSIVSPPKGRYKYVPS